MPWFDASKKVKIANSKEIAEEGNVLDARQANKDIEGTLAHDIYKELSEVKKSASDGKTAVAAAITAMNQATASSAAYSTMAANIRKISNDATAGAAHILTGKTAYAGGKKITGTMPDRGIVSHKLPINGTYTIPEGYHNGAGKVTQDITTMAGRIFMPGTSDQYAGPGYYLAGKLTIKGDASLVPENIAKGRSIFGVNGSLKHGNLKLTLGTWQILENIAETTNIESHFEFTGGPDGLKWYNLRVPSGKVGTVKFNISQGMLGNSDKLNQFGVLIRSIDYGTNASGSGKKGYGYGPLYYDDYWLPGSMYNGYITGSFPGLYLKKFAGIYYSFVWGKSDKTQLTFTFSNREGASCSGDCWTQRGFTFYPITGIDFNSFDTYEGNFTDRDILGAGEKPAW